MTKQKKDKLLALAKKACLGKVKHKSMLAAEFVLNKMKGPNSYSLEIYSCRFCNFFHIGHNHKKEYEKNSVKQTNLHSVS